MANDSPEAEYRNARNRLESKHEQGDVSNTDFELITEFLDAKDRKLVTVGNTDTKTYATLKSYCYRLMWTSIRFETDVTLSRASASDINQLMSDFLTGRNKDVKDDGLANKTVRLYQSALRSFHRYHDLDVDREEIAYAERDDNPVDERNLFTSEDIETMRNACPNTRDRCIMELLLNTGQRIRAIQTLRIKDVDLDEGVFYLNDEDGLKGAEGKRPLLGARSAVRDWLEFHPTNDSEDYLITGLHSYNREKGDVLTRQQIRRRIKKIADNANVTKPVNPHQWRHYCVTMLKRDYNLDNDTIKWLIGHAPDSRVMETTYSHLTDEDYIEQAEIATEISEETTESPLTPPRCPTCDNPLSSDAKACEKCGEVFTPDAKATQDQLTEDAEELVLEVESEREAKVANAILKDLREDPQSYLERLED